ncbi:MAG TPA: tRNA epoxyqueuosine(34) reductase QueG [Thermomicrobiales bacterium]|nr:tRNA epoxyqueuosine(34) reductase QueG [Thermomicrobiales bacterium]
MSAGVLSRSTIARRSREIGLAVVGVTTAEPFADLEPYVVDHVERGHMAGMRWFTAERARQSMNPVVLHPGARSIISVAVPFWSGIVSPPDDGLLRGRIARYAWGRDYHVTLKQRMRRLVALLEAESGRSIEARVLVDTARASDRAIAARAGVGWHGKNTMIIIPGHSSWAMLGEIIVDFRLPADPPLAKDCGRCAICIARCPTGAIVEPYRVDSNLCVSYLTIEERGPIPHELRSRMGTYVFGCDICQDVCPYTAAAKVTDDPDFRPRSIDNVFPSLGFLATMTEEQFREAYSGTPVTRAKRSGMARNAAVALGNTGDPRAEPILIGMLLAHDLPLARGHAAAALTQLAGDEARRTLRAAWRAERDEYVRSEIHRALTAVSV